MAKQPTITTVASGFASRETINDNFTNVRDKFDNTLSLDGSTPNAMGADLDLNNNDLLNGGTVAASVMNVDSLFLNGSQVTTSVSTVPVSSSRGEEVYLLDRMTETQAEAALNHTLTDDMSPLINSIIGEAGVTRLVMNGLIPISSPIDITVAKLDGKGFHIHTNTQGRAREVGGTNACILQKKSDWVGGYAIEVNDGATEVIKSVHLSGFTIDGNGQSGGGCAIRWAQDIFCSFSVIDDLGYGLLLNGVWNSDFSFMLIKDCMSGGIIFRPNHRENSNLSFTNQPWVAACGGLGEVVFEDHATNTNGTIRFDNILCEATTNGTDSPAMIVIENGKRIQFDIPQITSPDGRDSNCVQIGVAGRTGSLEDITFNAPNFNNTGTKTNHHCIDLIGVPSDTVEIIAPGKKGNDRFFKSDATTSDLACWIISKGTVISAATDMSDLNDARHVSIIDRSVDIGNKGSAASRARVVGMVEGKGIEFGSTATGGTEETMFMDPDGTGGAYLDMNDLRFVLGNGSAPSTAASTGRTGEIMFDGSYIYVCTAADTWKRVAIATW